MKRLKNFVEIMNKCSRCGLCQGVCPVFNCTKNDCSSPRGKIIMLKEFITKGGKPSKKLKEYMKMCFNCGKCYDYCPVKIDIRKINEAFSKDFSDFNFKSIIKIPYIVKIFFTYIICRIKGKKLNNIKENQIVVFQKAYKKKISSDITKNSLYKIHEECIPPIKFYLQNSKIYKELAEISVKEILKYNPDLIITSSFDSFAEIKIGLKELNEKKEIIFSNEY